MAEEKFKVMYRVIADNNIWYDRVGELMKVDSKQVMLNIDNSGIWFGKSEVKKETPFWEEPIEEVMKRQKATTANKHNSHYENMGITPFDVVDTWPLDQRVGAYRAFAVKYLMRMDVKEDRLTQAEKAMECNRKLIETIKKG